MMQKDQDSLKKLVEKSHEEGFINKNNKWEVGCFLRYNQLVYYKNNKRKGISKFGLMFLNSKNPKRFIVETYFKKKYLATKHKDVFVYVWNSIFRNKSVFENMRKSFFNSDSPMQKIEEWEEITAREIKSEFSQYGNKKLGIIKRIVGYAGRAVTVGVFPPYFLPYNQAQKVFQDFDNELDGLKNKIPTRTILLKKDRISLYEEYLEAIIRKNFTKLFPSLRIIDDNRQHITSNNNFIDILAKQKNDGHLYVIELKRYRSPHSALTQLLDYMNQIRKDFDTNKVKGILICSEIDNRLKSAVEIINQDRESIALFEYDIPIIINKIL